MNAHPISNTLTERETEKLTGITGTGIRGREIIRASRIGNGILTPEDPAMRFQLGTVHIEKRQHHPVEGVMLRLETTEVSIFTLLAWGASWEAVAERYRAKYLSNGSAPAEPAKPSESKAYSPELQAFLSR